MFGLGYPLLRGGYIVAMLMAMLVICVTISIGAFLADSLPVTIFAGLFAIFFLWQSISTRKKLKDIANS